MRRTAVIFAVYWELMPFARKLGIGVFGSFGRVMTAGDGDIILGRSGIGVKKAESLTDRIIDDFKPDLVISAGFCGALVDDLKIGDIVVSDLKDRKVFCSPEPLFTCHDKTAAFHKQGAVVVDMESDGVAASARRNGVDFIAIKAVSDTLLDELPKAWFRLLLPPRLLRLKRAADLASKNLAEFIYDYINKGAS